VAIRYKAGLPPEVLAHLYVKDHVACDLLVSGWQLRDVLLPNFKSKSNVFHFLADCVPPKRIAILFIKCFRFFDSLWDLDSKVVSPDPIFGLQFRDDSVSFLQNMSNRPRECRLSRDSSVCQIFSKLHWI
jgi:hypothetical protein